ncbi:MAG: PD40 domain-containing protein, partial [Leptospiraceae bacterium]|nr:PD40 domain-containing protein [Leptospiraceae bacterium]
MPWLLSTSAACAVYAPARVSVSSNGTEGNAVADGGAISADGRWVVFSSDATNLVTGDTNGFRDIFLHDRSTSETTRVSVATGGIEASGGQSLTTDISDDGRYIAFLSEATNLVAGDTNGFRDAFVHDRITGVTTRVSVSTAGVQGDAAVSDVKISGDGRYVAFASPATTMVAGDTNGLGDTFLHDRLTGETTRQSVTSGGAEGTGGTLSQAPGISSDAALYVFSSGNTNLVASDTNASIDIFVRDRTASTTTRVSVATGGTEG